MKIQAIIVIVALLFASCHNDHGQELLGCGHDHSHDNTTKKTATPAHIHTDNCDHSHDHDHEHDHELYGVIHIKPTPFAEAFRTGGEILSSRGDEQIVVANHDGLVFFTSKSMQEGVAVKANQQLVTLTSGGLVHDNLEVGYLEAKAQFEKARVDFERAKKLVADNIISEGEFLDAKLAFDTSQLTFENIRRNYADGGKKVLSPQSGFVKRIHVAEGEFVQAGQPLFTITENRRLVVKAELPQRALAILNAIRSANFITPYNGKVYSSDELNGRLISLGKSTAGNSFYIPVFFEVDNKGDLIPGTFVEVYLKSAAGSEAIAIPQTALLEEFGNHYVFIDNHDGWEKRYVKLGGTDGMLVGITDGLKAGEHVATKNVSRIKLTQMAGQLPEHAHVH